MKAIRISLIVSFTLSSSLIFAQDNESNSDFLLFERVEQPNNSSTSSTERPVRGSRSPDNNGKPAFTLVGTSRIGNSHHAILKHNSGNDVRVKLNLESNVQVPGYLKYQIVDFGSGTVSIRLPEDTPCVESKTLGVSCNTAGNIALMSLANGNPLPSPIEEVAPEENVSDSTEESSDANVAPNNPFSQIREQRRQATQEGQSAARFTPRRIPPEDVPDGMRVVSTPFGDRLVEE